MRLLILVKLPTYGEILFFNSRRNNLVEIIDFKNSLEAGKMFYCPLFKIVIYLVC